MVTCINIIDFLQLRIINIYIVNIFFFIIIQLSALYHKFVLFYKVI